MLVVGIAGNAHALKPEKHAAITTDRCTAAGLPQDFCTRAATEDYDTDRREWTDLSAHAQIADDQTACEAADVAAQRLWTLGDQLRQALAAVAASPTEDNVGQAGAALGRALHTIQDDCAHHGMPNPQHAWWSLDDYCNGTTLSPDVQDSAAACASSETATVIALVAAAVRDSGTADSLGALSCASGCTDRDGPTWLEQCDFIGEASNWDGIDRRWNNDVAVPALRAAFAAGLAGSAAPASVCGGDESVLSAAVSDPIVDVSGGTLTCAKAHVLCLGKADTDGGPFADDPAPASGGCTVGDPRGGVLVLGALLMLARRRRGRPLRGTPSLPD
ncbi:MAG: hypothetical protein ACM31C_24735 [Acidobacteriota bacterium]